MQGIHSSNNTKVLEGNIIIDQYINDIIDMFLSVTTYICFHNDNCAVFALKAMPNRNYVKHPRARMF